MRVPESFRRPANILPLHGSAFRNKNKDKNGEEVIQSNPLESSDETPGAQYPIDDFSFKAIPTEAYQCAKPLLALLKAFECKVSYEYEFDPTSSTIWYVSLKDRPDEQLLVQRLVLFGASMILEGDDFGVLNVGLLNEMGNADRGLANQDGLSFENC